MKIQLAQAADAPELAALFMAHIDAHREYISHGELQMGVGEGYVENGSLQARPAADGREKWMQYIQEHIQDSFISHVWKAVADDGTLLGFSVAEIQEDGDAPFGVVCDLLVKEAYRGQGIGAALLQTALDWLGSMQVKGIYLESGKNNHDAHRFFERRGFVHVSEIYKLG